VHAEFSTQHLDLTTAADVVKGLGGTETFFLVPMFCRKGIVNICDLTARWRRFKFSTSAFKVPSEKHTEYWIYYLTRVVF